MKGIKYLLIFLVCANVGIGAMGQVGVFDDLGVDPTNCNPGAAEDARDAADSAADDTGSGGLETLWGFYTTITDTLSDMITTINPAAEVLTCAVGPDLEPMVNTFFAAADIAIGFAVLSFLRGVNI